MTTLLQTSTSRELSGWRVLAQVEAEEHQREKDLAESGDGKVYVDGELIHDRPVQDDEDENLSDGETE